MNGQDNLPRNPISLAETQQTLTSVNPTEVSSQTAALTKLQNETSDGIDSNSSAELPSINTNSFDTIAPTTTNETVTSTEHNEELPPPISKTLVDFLSSRVDQKKPAESIKSALEELKGALGYEQALSNLLSTPAGIKLAELLMRIGENRANNGQSSTLTSNERKTV